MKSSTAILAIAVLVGMAGCKQMDTFHEESRLESARLSDDIRREARRARMVEASSRSAAYADSVCGIAPKYTTSTERTEK